MPDLGKRIAWGGWGRGRKDQNTGVVPVKDARDIPASLTVGLGVTLKVPS